MNEAGALPRDLPFVPTPQDRCAWAPDVPRSLRTEWNVRDASATLIVCPASHAAQDPGTCFTRICCHRYGRPVLQVDPFAQRAAGQAKGWLQAVAPAQLNIAGPAESRCPGLQAAARALLVSVLTN